MHLKLRAVFGGSPPFVLTGGGVTPLVVDQFHNTRINTFDGEPLFIDSGTCQIAEDCARVIEKFVW